MAEYDKETREKFLEKYGFQHAREYFVVHDGKCYDCKPLLWGAFFHQHGYTPENRATGGTLNTVKPQLEALGFVVISADQHQAHGGLCETSRNIYPDELDPSSSYVEGATKQVIVNAHERNLAARKACLDHYKYDCVVCGFNFETRYGEIGKNFMHVHHLNPLSLTEGEYEVNPITDLRPVCPNCHAMLHRGTELISIEQLRDRLNQCLPNSDELSENLG
jgi:hypothetical protein